MSSTSSSSSSSSGQESVSLLPLWVPSSFLPLILSSPVSNSLDKKLADEVKDKVMTGSQFYVTSSDSVPGAAVFRGNIRTSKGAVYDDGNKNGNNVDYNNNSTAVVFQSIYDRLSFHGLDKHVQLFLLPDPEWNPRKDEREPAAKPVILALPKTITPDESKTQLGKISSATQVRFLRLLFFFSSLSHVEGKKNVCVLSNNAMFMDFDVFVYNKINLLKMKNFSLLIIFSLFSSLLFISYLFIGWQELLHSCTVSNVMRSMRHFFRRSSITTV